MNRKNVFAIILTITMCLSLLPAGVYADPLPGSGTLAVTSSPAGADVYIDDDFQTVVTPAELDLDPGTYQLKLSIPGYEDYSEEVEINAGNTTAIKDIVQLPELVETAPVNIITVNSGEDSAPAGDITVADVKEQETITLRDAVTAIMNDTSENHYRIEFAAGVSAVSLSSTMNINRRGNLTINGDRDRNGTADIKVNHSGATNFSAINVITSDTYIIGLKFDGSANPSKASFLSLRVPDESADVYNINNLYILGCEFINTFEVGVATCGACGYGASGYGLAGTTNFSNLVFAGNSFNRSGLFSFAGAGDEDYNVIDGYTIAANQFVNCGVGMLAGDAHTWYVYGQDSTQGNGGVPGQIGYCKNNKLGNVLISGNSILLNSDADEEYTSIINISAANLGNSGNILEKVTIRNNISRVNDPAGKNVFATLAIGNVSIGDGGNLPNYEAPNFIHSTSNNVVKDVTIQYNDFQLGNGRGFQVYNVTTDVNDQEGSGNTFRNIVIDSNKFDSAGGVTIANYIDKSQCGLCSDNNTESIYFTNNTVTAAACPNGDKTGIVAANAIISNQFGSPVTDMPDYSGTMEDIVVDGNKVSGDYRYGIVAAGSAGDYADGMGIEGLSVCNNTVNINNEGARFGIVAAGGVMGTYGNPAEGAPYQPGSTNCFLKNVTINDNIITSEGGIAVCGDLYESAPRADSIAGNHVDTVTIKDNSITKQGPGEPDKDLPGILIAGIADMWNRLGLTNPTLGGNRVIGETTDGNTITGFSEGKEILNLRAVNDVYPVDSITTGENILSGLKALTDSAYGSDSYGWEWSGTAYDSSEAGSYMAKGSRQNGNAIDMLYYEIVVDPDAYETAEGVATVTGQKQFLAALDDDAVTHIIAKSADYRFEPGFCVLEKNITIDSTASLEIGDDCRVVLASGFTLTLNGDASLKQNGELIVGGTLVNNAKLTVGGIMKIVAPAVVEIGDTGSIIVSDDPERGFGHISVFDIISEKVAEPHYTVSSVTFTGSDPGLSPEAFSWTADVNGPKSLDHAMATGKYTDIILSGFQDPGEESGITATYTGDIAVTKPLVIEKNDNLIVNGNVTVTYPDGELVIDGALDVSGNLTNENIMYIDGILNIGGEGINNSYYMLTPRGTVNNNGAELLIPGNVGANYSRGYYVECKDDWDAALEDEDHCYEIFIGDEVSASDAIKISGDIELFCNLRVEGELEIDEGSSLTLNRRFDHGKPYSYDEGNHIYGTVTNCGTLNANIWMDICGTLENKGTINLAGYDENESGNWITDGHVYLYSFFDETEEASLNGFLENFGIITNRNFISINDNSSLENWPSGEIYNYGEITQWFRAEGAQFPLNNRGVIYGRMVDLDYIHLCYQWLDRDEDKFFEPGEVNTDSRFVEQPGHTADVLFMVYDYDSDQGKWVYKPIGRDALTADPYDEMDPEKPIFAIEAIPEEDVSDNAELTANKDKYATVRFLDWGENLMGYRNGTEEGDPIYLLPVTVKLPELGFYSSAAVPPTTANYINTFGGFAYGPNSEPELRTFYMIADIGDKILNSDPSFEYVIIEGGGKVSVEPTYDYSGAEPVGDKRVYKIIIKDNVYGGFPLYIRLTAKNSEKVLWDESRFIWIEEEESEGLAFAWPDWKDGQKGDYRFNYPILQENRIEYETNADISIGGATVSFFFRQQDGEGNWVYESLSAGQLSVVQNDSGIDLKEWEDLEAGDIPGNDPEHTGPEGTNYKFTQMDTEKFGNYTLRYTVGSGGEQVNYDLPVTVRLPDVAFYSEAQATEANYIKDFTYSSESRTFYMIAKPDFEVWDSVTSEYEIYDGGGKFDVAAVENTVGVYCITVKDDVSGEARFHGKIRLLDNGNEIWFSDRDIFVSEEEAEGLAYRNLDWDGEAGGHFENMDWGLETRLNADPRGHAGIFYKKESDGQGGWDYTPVEVQLDNENMTVSTLEQDRIYSGNDESKNVDNAEYYRGITFKKLGSFGIKYTELPGEPGEKTFTMSVNVDLPSLGAYKSTDKNMDNWLREVDFADHREALLIPHGVDMANVDLNNSEFRAKGDILTYDSDNDVFLWDDGIGGVKLKVKPYREEGLIKHFTATVLLTPFAGDFDLEIRLRDGEGWEIAGNNIRFMSSLPDADVENTGIVLDTPVEGGLVNDKTVTLPNVPAHSIHYATFVSGDLDDGGYLLQLTGDSTGALLYLFDENWILIDQSAFENLSEEGRSATIWTIGLTSGKSYYLAAHNESDLESTMQLSAGLRSTPALPVVRLEHSDQGSLGLEVSGATEGQHYVLFAKIDGVWQNRGWEPFNEEQEPRFVHAFDLLNDGEMATAFATAIDQDGIRGERAEIAVNVTRSDTSASGLDVIRMEIPESSRIYLMIDDGETIFADGAYIRFHHEDDHGRWDYNGSLFGDGSGLARGDGFVGPDGVAETGTWILAEYTESGGEGTYTIGWKTYIDTGKSLGRLSDEIFDIFLCNIESETRKVNASLEIYTIDSGSFDCIFALYDEDGRMVDMGIKKGVKPVPSGTSLNEVLFYPEGKTAKWCKIFLLNEDTYQPAAENYRKSL